MSSEPMDSLKELVSRPDEEIDPAHAALLIAASQYPALNIDHYQRQFTRWARELRSQIPPNADPVTAIQILNEFLFSELGFRGDSDDYYDPRNSYLNEVIERRRGIPITLALVYMALARRLGLGLEGVSFPGHFLVKLAYGGGAVVLDPFNRGVSLSVEDLQQRIAQVLETEVDSLAPFLAAASNKQILLRMLYNLKGIYAHHGDHDKSVRIIDMLLAIDPELIDEYRDRGLALHTLECHNSALKDFQAYLSARPEAEDAGRIRRLVIDLHPQHSRLN